MKNFGLRLATSLLSGLAFFMIGTNLTLKPSVAFERCTGSNVQRIAENYTQTVVTDQLLFPIPQRLIAQINQCQYFPSEKVYTMNIDVSWRGPLENKPYTGNLRLRIDANGGYRYELLDWNTYLARHLVTMGLIGAAVNSLTSDSSSQPYNFHVHNKCNRPVQIALSYKDTDNRWKTKSWWQFDPFEQAFLMSGQQRLVTKNSAYYFYAETTDGSSFVWQGDNYLTVDGVKLGFRKGEDKQGHTEIVLTCG